MESDLCYEQITWLSPSRWRTQTQCGRAQLLSAFRQVLEVLGSRRLHTRKVKPLGFSMRLILFVSKRTLLSVHLSISVKLHKSVFLKLLFASHLPTCVLIMR